MADGSFPKAVRTERKSPFKNCSSLAPRLWLRGAARGCGSNDDRAVFRTVNSSPANKPNGAIFKSPEARPKFAGNQRACREFRIFARFTRKALIAGPAPVIVLKELDRDGVAQTEG